MNASGSGPPGKRARLRRNEDDGQKCAATQTAEAIILSLTGFDREAVRTATGESVRAADD